MASIPLTPPSDYHKIRDPSFSSYLNNVEQDFIVKLSEPKPNFKSITELGRKTKEEDGEIGVFGAEKYFNGVMDDENPRTVKQKKERDDVITIKPPKIQPGTPSTRSQSSWNSQNALLASTVKQPNKGKHGKRFLAVLGCNCPCSDKNSIDVDNGIHEESTKTISNPVDSGSKGEDGFSFPVKLKFPDEEKEEDNKRKSLEVFGSPVAEKIPNVPLPMLLGKLNPKAGEEAKIRRNSSDIYNDTDSDTSSDLFEIESFSGNNNPYLARQMSYEPSEASIEWSVVTASAADFSMVSDYEERKPEKKRDPSSVMGKPAMGKVDVQKRRPSLLLGCKSHKAVRVASDVYKTNERPKTGPWERRGSNSFIPETRFQAEIKLSRSPSRTVYIK